MIGQETAYTKEGDGDGKTGGMVCRTWYRSGTYIEKRWQKDAQS